MGVCDGIVESDCAGEVHGSKGGTASNAIPRQTAAADNPGTVVFCPCLAKFCEGVWQSLDAVITVGAVRKITALAGIARVGKQNSREGTCRYTAR
jgi:hypothetical protein